MRKIAITKQSTFQEGDAMVEVVKNSEHILPNLVGVYEYAKLKNVYYTTVYNAIKDDRIKMVLVGRSKIKMIDWEKYKDVEFQQGVGYHKNNPKYKPKIKGEPEYKPVKYKRK